MVSVLDNSFPHVGNSSDGIDSIAHNNYAHAAARIANPEAHCVP